MLKLSPKRRDSSPRKKDVMALAKSTFFIRPKDPDFKRQPTIKLGIDLTLVYDNSITQFVEKLTSTIKTMLKEYPEKGIQNNYLSLLQTEILDISSSDSSIQLAERAKDQNNKVNLPIIMHRISTWLKALEQYRFKLSDTISETNDDKTKEILVQIQKELLILFHSVKPIYDAYWHAEKQSAKHSPKKLSSSADNLVCLEQTNTISSPWSPARSSSSDSISPRSPRTPTGRISPGSHRSAYQSRLYSPSDIEVEKYFSPNGDADISGLKKTEEQYKKQFIGNLKSYVQGLISQEPVSSPRPKR